MDSRRKMQGLAKAMVSGRLEFEFSHMPFRIDGVDRRKLWNLALASLNAMRRVPRPPAYPVQLHVEISAVCGLRCPLCPTGAGHTERSSSFMPLNEFKRLVDEAGGQAVIALMWLWGEPTMNAVFPDMVAYAHSHGLATLSSTNGQALDSLDEAERLVASGLDCLIVSMDGATQETYEKYRAGGRIESLTRALALIGQARKRLGVETPCVNVQTVVTSQNEHELPLIERLAQEYGADLLSQVVTRYPDFSSREARARLAPFSAAYRGFVPQSPDDGLSQVRRYKCPRPWNRLTVTSDGVVTPCEHDYNGECAFGRADEGRSYLDVWRGERAETFRRRFIADKTAFRFCRDCTFAVRPLEECTLMRRLR